MRIRDANCVIQSLYAIFLTFLITCVRLAFTLSITVDSGSAGPAWYSFAFRVDPSAWPDIAAVGVLSAAGFRLLSQKAGNQASYLMFDVAHMEGVNENVEGEESNSREGTSTPLATDTRSHSPNDATHAAPPYQQET